MVDLAAILTGTSEINVSISSMDLKQFSWRHGTPGVSEESQTNLKVVYFGLYLG